jgi:hypothetical protein
VVSLEPRVKVLCFVHSAPAKGIRTNYQNTSGNVFSKVLPFERNGGQYWTRIRDTKSRHKGKSFFSPFCKAYSKVTLLQIVELGCTF